MRKLTLVLLIFLTLQIHGQSVSDIDGNVYDTVVIGAQVWLKENLKVTRYLNGESIPNVTDFTQWQNLTNGAYCNYNNDSNIANSYGRLYNWYATVDSRLLCPSGWRVPDAADWITLVNFISDSTTAGYAMAVHHNWDWNSCSPSNSSGFSAYAAGGRFETEGFVEMNKVGRWWSGTSYAEGSGSAWTRAVVCFFSSQMLANPYLFAKTDGASVRCLKGPTQNSIDNPERRKSLQISPNPATTHITLQLAPQFEQAAKIEVYDRIGQLLLSMDYSTEVDVSALPAGLYFVVVRIEDGDRATGKFIKD